MAVDVRCVDNFNIRRSNEGDVLFATWLLLYIASRELRQDMNDVFNRCPLSSGESGLQLANRDGSSVVDFVQDPNCPAIPRANAASIFFHVIGTFESDAFVTYMMMTAKGRRRIGRRIYTGFYLFQGNVHMLTSRFRYSSSKL